MVLQKKRSLVAVLVTVVMTVLRAVVVYYNMEKNNYENDTYYLPDNLTVRIFNALAIASIVLFVAFALSLLFTKKTSIYHDLSASPAGMLVLAFSMFFVVALFAKKLVVTEEVTYSPISLACVALALVCGLIFLVLGLKSQKSMPSNAVLSLLMLFPTTFSALRLVERFMDSNAAPLASSGDYRILGLASLLIFFLYDGKSYIHPKSAVIFYLSAFLSVFFLLVYSVPNLALHCFGTFSFDEHAAYSVADIGISVYICSRMFNAKLKTSIEE